MQKVPVNREHFFGFLQRLVTSGKIKAVSKIPLGSKLIVTRVADFDPKSNKVWTIQENKSYPREGLVCHKCNEPVVMSEGLFAQYSEKPQPENVLCGKCAFNL